MIDLNKCPVGEIHPLTSSKTRFALRIEERLPMDFSNLSEEVLLCETKSASLYSIETDQRILGYMLKLVDRPKVKYDWYYVLAFYGTRVSSVKIHYQDSRIRLVSGGNGNLVGLLGRSGKAEIPNEEEEEEIK